MTARGDEFDLAQNARVRPSQSPDVPASNVITAVGAMVYHGNHRCTVRSSTNHPPRHGDDRDGKPGNTLQIITTRRRVLWKKSSTSLHLLYPTILADFYRSPFPARDHGIQPCRVTVLVPSSCEPSQSVDGDNRHPRVGAAGKPAKSLSYDQTLGKMVQLLVNAVNGTPLDASVSLQKVYVEQRYI